MKVSKRQLRKIIREEKRKILNESCPPAEVPCPHATADALMSSGMSAGEILSWVGTLVNDLTQAEVSPPLSMDNLPAGALDAGIPIPSESRRRAAQPRVAGLIPGLGFGRRK